MGDNRSSSEKGSLWWSSTESPKAWMSVRDADLLEGLVHQLSLRGDGRLAALEWGAGRSTMWYPHYLRMQQVHVTWLALEHDRGYVRSAFTEDVRKRLDIEVVHFESIGSASIACSDGVTRVVAFDAGELFPAQAGRAADRLADLDSYVDLASQLGRRFDLVIVDGRKRRRCLLEAAQIVRSSGYVVLHDAWRQYYQCAWPAFRSHSRIGDELWIGTQAITDFRDILPWHAFERHKLSGRAAYPYP